MVFQMTLAKRLIPLIFFIATISCIYAVNDGVVTVFAPLQTSQLFETNEEDDLFEDCPTYGIDNNRQIIYHNNWSGDQDFNVITRVAWNSTSLFFRFDVTDDVQITYTEMEKNNSSNGDNIRVNMAHFTCGPDRTNQEWAILLYPNVEEGICSWRIETSSKELQRKIGKLKTKLITTFDGYSIILQLPYNDWDDLPRNGGLSRLQIEFNDADEKHKINHKFVLFPMNREIKSLGTRNSTFGNIHFVNDTFVTVYPKEVIYTQNTGTFLVDFGNFSESDISATVYLEDMKTGEELSVDSEPFYIEVDMPANSFEQGVPVEFDFSGMESGKFNVKAKTDVFLDSAEFSIKYSNKSGLTYCQKLIERRRHGTQRRLEVANNPALAKETFSYMAGGGEVLWNLGKYDASSQEFPQYVRNFGEHKIDISTAKLRDVPWAIFGGMSTLDGMNEPLILDFSNTKFDSVAPLTPDSPLYGNKSVPSKAERNRYKYLLLVGITTRFIDADSIPEILIRSGSRTLIEEKIMPKDHGDFGKRHAYVFRIWLSSLSNQISIENPSRFGPRFEIDFISILGGKNDSKKPEQQSSIRFSGTPEAELFSKMCSTSLFFMKNYLVDIDGVPYSSLPGGSHTSLSLKDWGLLMSELSIWACLDQASLLARQAPLYLGTFIFGNKKDHIELGDASIITGINNTWRKLGKPNDFISPLWLNAIHRPLVKMLKEMETNPLGLVNSHGEFGSSDIENPAATIPMYFALQAGIGSAVELARDGGYAENAQSWKLASDRYKIKFNNHLVSPDNQIQLVSQKRYPEAWGIKEQIGIVSLLPKNAWLYGRYENEKPMLYNGNIRVFDTPYLLSGISFWSDYSGFLLDEDTLAQLQASSDFIFSFSPLFRQSSWSKFSVLEYNSSLPQLWTVTANLLLDNIPMASNSLNSYIKYSFDEFIPLPSHSDIEISPYTFEDNLSVAGNGDNNGNVGDDLTISNGVNGLRIARIIAGIDDFDPASSLKLIPRLPKDWEKVEVKNWLINTNSTPNLAKIDYSYEKSTGNRFIIMLDSSEKLSEILVRVGPFPAKIRKVRFTGEGQRKDVNTVRHGINSWAFTTLKKVKSFRIAAQAIIY